ncbi:MAG: UbiA family prenyltransferase [Chloroflexota bacterium]
MVLGIAWIAGGSPASVMRLALAMTLIQFAIGTTNDLADAARDGDRVPAKPIAAGLVRRRTAAVAASVFGLLGLALAAVSGVLTFGIALAGLACGLVYNARMSRSALSWLPLTLALPLLPIFAWYGAVGSLPGGIVPIVPIAMLAGAGLAIGNGLIDLDLDAARGRRTTAVALGRAASWAVHALALIAAIAAALTLMPSGGGASGPGLLMVGAGTVLVGMVGLAVRIPAVPRLAWAIEAIGIALIGLAWVLAVAPEAR